MLTVSRRLAAFCAIAFSFLATVAADDAFYQVRLGELKIESKRPEVPATWEWQYRERSPGMHPYIVLDGQGEAYLGRSAGNNDVRWDILTGQEEICVRVPKVGDISGRLYWPKNDWNGMIAYKFTIPVAKAKADARQPFFRAKEHYYDFLLERDIPGGAWFRHEISESQAAQNIKRPENNFGATRRTSAIDSDRFSRTYELFSGGRAISENLQLDRAVRETKPEEATVDIKTITGITVKEIDWKPLIKDLKPALDPLAASIPADQHVIFFPTFSAAALTADQAEIQGTPVLRLAEPRSEDALTAKRYERQLGLSLTGVGRLLGPKVAKSVALTGSDLSFRTGTDVALLFEAENPSLLEGLLMAQVQLAASKTPTAKEEEGEAGGLKYHGFHSPDRAISSYVARSGNAVIVTNSLEQLQRLGETAQRKTPAIDSLPEYVFFRNRYKLGDAEETGFVFLSDATIRRWCGPRWRIATSRQARDLAVLAELQAANLDALVKKTIEPGTIYTNFITADVGKLTLDASGVRSSVQGSLDFLTPIVEMPLDRVTQSESIAYGQWRDGYQRNWSWAFDPIALRLTLEKTRLAADLTVMPLILGTEYREFASLSSGAKFAPDAGDPHDALLHFILSINTKGPQFHQAENMISTMSSGVTLGWVGSSIAVYADDDPVWQEFSKIASEKNTETFLLDNVHRLPIAIQVEVSNGFRLAAFLAATRAWIEQSAPGMVAWESLKYKDQPYVKITPTERAKGQNKAMEKIAVYYTASGDALVVTLHEGVLKRAIDRQLTRQEAAKNGDKATGKSATTDGNDKQRPWLGSSVGLQVDRKAIAIFTGVFDGMNRDARQSAMQVRAWSNLPILNEWKRLYPDRDPVEVHEQVWKIRLICPGGGTYVWNEKFQTMESSLYGHPAEPKVGPIEVPLLSDIAAGSFGLTFEQDGLRARVSLERDETPKKQ
jgi:hypothetical protein